MNVQFNVDALGKALNRLEESLSFDISQPLVVDAYIQQAYSIHWLKDETEWLSMLKDRNLTSHTYKEDLAVEIYHRLPAHFEAMMALYRLLNTRFIPN